MRIAMPLAEDNGKQSMIHPHFGHIQIIGIYDSVKGTFETVRVKPTQGCSPIAAIEGLKVDAIYTAGMGMRAMQLCSEMGIKLKTGSFGTVNEVIENLEKLKDLQDSCGH